MRGWLAGVKAPAAEQVKAEACWPCWAVFRTQQGQRDLFDEKKIDTKTSQDRDAIMKEIEKLVQQLRTCGQLGAGLALLISFGVHAGRL